MHLHHVSDVIGRRQRVRDLSAIRALILRKGTYFVSDTHVTPDPTAEEIAEMAILAADAVRRFGIEPKVALLSHSGLGSIDCRSARKMQEAQGMPDVEAADIAYNLVKMLGDALPIGPILIGVARPIHTMTEAVTARGLVNMSALAVVDAQIRTGRSLRWRSLTGGAETGLRAEI